MQADIYFKRFISLSELSDEQLAELSKFDKYLVRERRYYRIDAYTLHLMCVACSLNQATRKELFDAWTNALAEDITHNLSLGK